MTNIKLVVPDSSCLILFQQLNRMNLLDEIINKLGGKLVLLSPVLAELRTVPDSALVSLNYSEITMNDFQQYQSKFHIGKGEASIIKFGENKKIVAIIDDFKAKKIAQKMGITVRGTLGLLGTGYILCPIETKDELIDLFFKVRSLGFRIPSDRSLVELVGTLSKKMNNNKTHS